MTQIYNTTQDVILNDSDLSLLEEFISDLDTIIEPSEDLYENLGDSLYVAKVEFAERLTMEFGELADLCNIPLKGRLSLLDFDLKQECRFVPPRACTVPGITPKGIMTSMQLLGGLEEFFPEKAIVIASTGQVIIRMRPLYASACVAAEFVLSTSKDELDALSSDARAIDEALNRFLFELFGEIMLELRDKLEVALREYYQKKSFFSISENYGTAQVW